jgi:hypothetical protein
MSTDLTRPGLERPATRADLARQLLARVDRLESLLGTVPLATEVQLLKRDLSRGHELLRPAGETNYLSVVVLVEAALAGLTWKQYTPEVVDALRRAFTTGTRQGALTFDDYDAVRRLFRERSISVVPTIDLDALGPEDLDDGQEG